MIGFSWAGRSVGGIEIWGDGIVVSVNGKPSSTLDDRDQIEMIRNELTVWLAQHPKSR